MTSNDTPQVKENGIVKLSPTMVEAIAKLTPAMRKAYDSITTQLGGIAVGEGIAKRTAEALAKRGLAKMIYQEGSAWWAVRKFDQEDTYDTTSLSAWVTVDDRRVYVYDVDLYTMNSKVLNSDGTIGYVSVYDLVPLDVYKRESQAAHIRELEELGAIEPVQPVKESAPIAEVKEFTPTHRVTWYKGAHENVILLSSDISDAYGFPYGTARVIGKSGERTIQVGRFNALAIEPLESVKATQSALAKVRAITGKPVQESAHEELADWEIELINNPREESAKEITLTTDKLKVNDVVITHGMRVLIVSAHKPYAGNHGALAYSFEGKVTNLAEVLADGLVPASFLQRQEWVEGKGWTTVQRDYWQIQGSDALMWSVERPATQSNA